MNNTVLSGFDFMSLLPIFLILLIFYFLILRPQQKKAKQQQDMLSLLKRGDRVITNSGIIGSIHRIINDEEIQLEIAEGVRIRFLRASISHVVSKTVPLEESKNHLSDNQALDLKESSINRR